MSCSLCASAASCHTQVLSTVLLDCLALQLTTQRRSALHVTVAAPCGGPADNGFGPARGGVTSGIVPVAPGQVLLVFVGGVGGGQQGKHGGWNGGADGSGGSGGGGASDIRTDLNLGSRLLVAGGGGGSPWSGGTGGAGGGLTGAGGCSGNQANQTAGGDVGKRGQGTFGAGGVCKGTNLAWCSGGGGGWYGGAAPIGDVFGGCNRGGGGSGFIAASVINGTSRGNANGGEGKVTIELVAGPGPGPGPAPAPGSGCDGALGTLCDAARREGFYQCGVCVGSHEAALAKAGCVGSASGEPQLFCRNQTCAPQLQDACGSERKKGVFPCAECIGEHKANFTHCTPTAEQAWCEAQPATYAAMVVAR
eukprot:COSAG05_NODE_4203_length_1624_cov_1.335738_2_plen_364_part_00